MLIEKMMASDGIVFASPNYSFHVSATMKMFLDRLGFVFHRPRFFGKTFTSIIAQLHLFRNRRHPQSARTSSRRIGQTWLQQRSFHRAARRLSHPSIRAALSL